MGSIVGKGERLGEGGEVERDYTRSDRNWLTHEAANGERSEIFYFCCCRSVLSKCF